MMRKMKERIIFPEFSHCDLLHHAPPYDSPLEEIFAYHFDKYKGPGITLYQQVQVNTICGPYWLDFAIKDKGKTIGIECDGKDYHENERDFWRDSMILGTGLVHAIYRFCGRDIDLHINICLFLLSEVEPQIFSERGIINLNQLHTSDTCGADYNGNYSSENGLSFSSRRSDEDHDKVCDTEIYIKKRQSAVFVQREPEWLKYFNFPKDQDPNNLREIMERYRRLRR